MNKSKLDQFEALEIEKKHQIHLKGGGLNDEADSEVAIEELEIICESFSC